MPNTELVSLGQRIAQLRIARPLRQTELAYEAGVSHRTLQRLEAGEPIRSDGLLKVIRCLGRLEPLLAALEPGGFSPYEKLAEAGLKVSELRPRRPDPDVGSIARGTTGASATAHKRRVRRSRAATSQSAGLQGSAGKTVKVQWPEDQT